MDELEAYRKVNTDQAERIIDLLYDVECLRHSYDDVASKMNYQATRAERAEKQVRATEMELAEVRGKLELALASIYKKSTRDALTIANLCDEELDRSGALLGRVRALAATRRSA